MAQRVRLSVDILVPDDSSTSQREWDQVMREAEDHLRVVILPDNEIEFVKKGESNRTVHQHNSTRRISCRGCIELSDDLQGHIEGL